MAPSKRSFQVPGAKSRSQITTGAGFSAKNAMADGSVRALCTVHRNSLKICCRELWSSSMGLIDSTVRTADALVWMPDSALTIIDGLVSIPVVCFMTGLQKAQLEANGRAKYTDLRGRSTQPPERPSSRALHQSTICQYSALTTIPIALLDANAGRKVTHKRCTRCPRTRERLFHLKGDVLQLSAALHLQHDGRTRLQSLERGTERFHSQNRKAVDGMDDVTRE